MSDTEWKNISPNAHGDWINKRSDIWKSLRLLAEKENEQVSQSPIFSLKTHGLSTSRDVWCINSSEVKLRANIRLSTAFYNDQARSFQQTSPTGTSKELLRKAKTFVRQDTNQFHWNDKQYRNLQKNILYSVDEDQFRTSIYRPFFKQFLYFSAHLNERPGGFQSIFPEIYIENTGIALANEGTSVPFHVIMSDVIVDSHLNGDTAYFPRYRYVQSLTGKLERVSNIDPAALKEFRQHFGDASINDDDLFYFTYGVLHSEQYRATFANDLAKSPARIPMAGSLADFRAFVAAGRRLAHLHVNYESVAPYPLQEIHTKMWHEAAPDAYRVEKMKYAGKRQNQDKSTIIYNAGITLSGIPAKAHDYRLGTRSALDWLIDRYRVKTDKKSGITNDVNDWADELGEPRYILDLIKRVTTVSIETVDIVNSLPELPV